MTIRLALLAALVASAGCAGREETAVPPDMSAHQAYLRRYGSGMPDHDVGGSQPTNAVRREDEPRRSDDPGFSENERAAVRAATEAVLEREGAVGDPDQALRYEVSTTDDGWLVLVWRAEDSDGTGTLQPAPGAQTFVHLDRNFKPLSVAPSL